LDEEEAKECGGQWEKRRKHARAAARGMRIRIRGRMGGSSFLV